VLQEILYRYSSLGRLDLAGEVYDLVVEICPVVLDVTLADTDRARDLLCRIATFDAGFDKVRGIRRLRMA
jgi:hypothetical protein